MRFAENMLGLCVMAALLQCLLLRVRGRATPLYRTVVVASVLSGLTWVTVWILFARTQWSWKTPDFSTTNPALDVFFLILAALLWCCFATIPASITGMIYRRLFLR
jgi:hypothetical protein